MLSELSARVFQPHVHRHCCNSNQQDFRYRYVAWTGRVQVVSYTKKCFCVLDASYTAFSETMVLPLPRVLLPLLFHPLPSCTVEAQPAAQT